jgi:exonuclease VII small subunit
MSERKQKEQKQSIVESLSELEGIVAWFEKQEEIDVEVGLGKVKQGAELIKSLKTRLRAVENEFKEIKEDVEAEYKDDE